METENFYSQTHGADVRRTYIHGMPSREEVEARKKEGIPDRDREELLMLQDRPIAGMLFSDSSDSRGEIFPLYVGRNSIGSDPEADIYLPEATVAPDHALILVRRLRDDYGREITTVTLSATDPDNSLSIDGERIFADRYRLAGGERILIGSAYQLQLTLLRPSESAGEAPFRPLPRQRHRPAPHDDIESRREGGEEKAAKEEVKIDGSVSEAEELTFYGRSSALSKGAVGGATTLDNVSPLYGARRQAPAQATLLNRPAPENRDKPEPPKTTTIY